MRKTFVMALMLMMVSAVTVNAQSVNRILE